MSCSKAQRLRQRALRRQKRREEPLDRRNVYGVLDLTPREAVKRLMYA